MNKNIRNIIAGVVILAALSGTYIMISNDNKQGSSQNTKTETIINASGTEVYSINVMRPDGNGVMLEKDNKGKWISKGNEDKLLNIEKVNAVISSAKKSAPIMAVEGKSNPSEYGLLSPSATAEIKYVDGSSETVYIGDKTVDGAGYYVMVDGDTNIYIVNSADGENLSACIDDVRERYLYAANPDKLEIIEFKQRDGIDITIKENPIDSLNKSYGYGYYIMYGAYQENVSVLSDALKNAIIKPATSIIIQDFIKSGSPADYGLDNPVVTLYMKDVYGNVVDLSVGNVEDDKVYIKYGQSDEIYTTSYDIIEPMITVDRFYLVDKYVSLNNIEDIERIEVDSNGVYTDITTKKYTDVVGEEKKEVVKTDCFVDGKAVETSDFKDFYFKVIDLNIDSEIGNNVVGDVPVLTLDYTLTFGKQIHVRFFEYDSNFYALERDGFIEFVVDKSEVQALIEARDNLVSIAENGKAVVNN